MATAADRRRREERVKLASTGLSNVGVATIVTGFIAPLVTGRLQLVGIVAVAAGFAFHLAAQLLMHYVAADPEESALWIGR